MIRLSALTVLLAVLSASSYASPLQGRDVDLRIPSPWRVRDFVLASDTARAHITRAFQSAGSSRSSSKRKAISKAAVKNMLTY